ncbi:hypothetical protein GCM10027605_74950 [Micromonospora zhanjiangensis]
MSETSVPPVARRSTPVPSGSDGTVPSAAGSDTDAPSAADAGVPNAARLTAAQRNAVAELLRVSPIADELGRRFARAGHELHLVGGSVRDALLGRLGNDLDFCTDAHPDQTIKIVKGWAESIWETGREFGTIGAQRDGLRLEITTFRAEAYDRVTRNPVVQYGTDLADDLKRRDFTINAMAVSLPDHRFTDPYGGLADLAARLIRTPERRRSRSATTRCGCCGRPGSPRSWASPSSRRPGPRWRPWPAIWTGSPRSGSGTSSASCSAARSRSRDCGCWWTAGWPTGFCRSCPG